MEDIMIDLPISPTLLRVVRVFRIGRILRLIKVRKPFVLDAFMLKSREFLGRKRNSKAFIRFSSIAAGFIQHRCASSSAVVCLCNSWNVTVRPCQTDGSLKRYDQFRDVWKEYAVIVSVFKDFFPFPVIN
jgi:hypothetical protein